MTAVAFDEPYNVDPDKTCVRIPLKTLEFYLSLHNRVAMFDIGGAEHYAIARNAYAEVEKIVYNDKNRFLKGRRVKK